MSTIRSAIRGEIRRGVIDGFALADIGISPENVIFSHNSRGLEPVNDYCVINILSNRQIGYGEESTRTRQGDTYLDQQLASTAYYYANVQFTFIGANAADNGMEFHNCINNNRQVVEAFQRRTLSPVNKTDLKILPQFRETDWVETSAFDLDFGYSVQRYQDIDWVEYIVVNGVTYRIIDDEE